MRTHQFFHSVIIRGVARVIPDGEKKTTVLNALVAKHEGNRDFPPVTSGSTGYKICSLVEIAPQKMTGKSDVGQNKPSTVTGVLLQSTLRAEALRGFRGREGHGFRSGKKRGIVAYKD